jgi:hypothetical protein
MMAFRQIKSDIGHFEFKETVFGRRFIKFIPHGKV